MKIQISYFYQIRNFTSNMIPISTACGDPVWYHPIAGDKSSQGFDKRGIWLGIRNEKLSPKYITCGCPCEYHKIGNSNCDFLINYKAYLDTLNFDNFLKDMDRLNNWVINTLNIDDPILVLMVHEAPHNPCSERVKIIEWFQDHGYHLEQFKK